MPHARSTTTRRFALASLTVFVLCCLMLVVARPAAAADHCVGSHPMCPVGPNNYPATATGLQDALYAANNNATFPGADTVWVAAGTYEPTSSISVGTASAELHVIGEGPGSTVIRQNANGIVGLSILNPSDHDVTVTGLSSVLQGFGSGSALLGSNVDYTNIEASAITSVGSIRAIWVTGNSIVTDAKLTVSGSSTTAAYMDNVTALRDSEVISLDGQSVGTTGTGDEQRTVERVSFSNVRYGINWDQGETAIRDVYIKLSASFGARGISAENSNNCGTCALNAFVMNATVIGSGSSQIGLRVAGSGDTGVAESGQGTVTNSLFHLTGTDAKALSCFQDGDVATASLSSTYVAAESDRIERLGACTGSDSDLLDTDADPPLFNFAAVGDYRPVSNSPVVDAGDPLGYPTAADADVDGLVRVVDGDGNASDLVDIGAHEYQAAMKPSQTLIDRTPAGDVDVAELISFDGTSVEPDGGSVGLDWDFGDGNSDTGNNVQHSYANPGVYTVTVTATDDELETSTTTHEVRVGSDPPTTPTIEANKSQAIRGESITFTASGSTDPDLDTIHYEWTFTGGGIATSNEGEGVARAATNMVNDPGPTTFTATVKAVDDNGTMSAAVSESVTIVNRFPIVSNINKSADTGYRGDTFTFQSVTSDTENDVVYKSWDVGDGSGPTTHGVPSTVDATYNTIGTKTITVSVRDAYAGQPFPGDTEDSFQTTIEVLNRDPVIGSIAHSGTLKTGDAQGFSLAANDGDGDPITYSWNYGDGTSENTGASGSASHVYSTPGSYTVTASVSDDQGSAVVATRTVTVSSRQATLSIGRPNKTFWLRGKGFTLGGKAPYAYIPIKNSEPVSVSISLTQVKGGYKKGKSCVKRKTGKKRCNLKLAGSQKLDLLDTSSKLMFGGKWRGKNLKPGRYIVTITPADGGPAKSVTIKLIKKKKK